MRIIKIIATMERSGGMMIEKFKYWLFQKGKSCCRCCLRCEYRDWGAYIPPADYTKYIDLTSKESEEET